MVDSSGPYDPSGALTHLVTHFQSRSITADHLERMHPSVRDHYVKMAGLNSMAMSEQGWNAVIDHMRRGKSSHG
jgi:hypothetical protein